MVVMTNREQIESTGAIIDDDGVACDGCGFGIRLVDLCVVDPDGLGPFHRECAMANGFDPKDVRIAPDEFCVVEQADFERYGKIISTKVN